MNSIIKEYKYLPNIITLFIVFCFFVLGFIYAAYLALTKDNAIVINGIIHLSPFGAKVFYWILTGIFCSFVILIVYGSIVNVMILNRIAITSDGIILPSGCFPPRESLLTFKEIEVLKIRNNKGQVHLSLYANGRWYKIAQCMLPKKSDFDEILSLLKTKLDDE